MLTEKEIPINRENRVYFNLRKRYGQATAEAIMRRWLHTHIEYPEDMDIAVIYYVTGDDLR